MDKKEYFKQWSEKLSLPIEQIQKEFDELVKEEKKVNNLSGEDAENRALKRLALAYKKQLRSPAEGFEGVVFGAEDARDMVAKKRKDAINLYKENPQEAIEKGITDEEGTPLDTIEVFSTGRENSNYGKPLPEKSLIRRVYGVAIKSKGDESPKRFEMVLNGDACEREIPIMKPVKFMAIDKGENDDGFKKLNASTFTEFKEVDSITGNPKIETLIQNFLSPIKISELQEYHDMNADNFNRLVAVEGTVSFLSLEPTSNGSRILQIEDEENIMDLDAVQTTCWIPQHVDVDFAEGSKVYVIGRTAQGHKKDEKGNITEELGDVTINVFGIYSSDKVEIPETKPIEDISIL